MAPIEGLLYEKLSGSRVRCHVCQWHCTIMPGKYGLCRMRQNKDGVLHILNYAEVSAVAVDPIEKKPLAHFFPSSLVLSLGSWGCNFHCQHCQNWQISCMESDNIPKGSQQVSPQAAIESARSRHCDGIAWTYNEPGIWFEYTLDSAKLAKENNLYTVYVTNGYLTPEAMDLIGPHLDAWRVDVKGFSDAAYHQLAKVHQWKGILDVSKRAQEKWGMHVEVVTNIVPSINDDEEQLVKLATWICTELGELTPWHVTRSHPQYKMTHIPSTSVSSLEKAQAIGNKAGLRFVYVGNIPGHNGENTVCYSCGNIVIRRSGYKITLVGLEGSKCKFCGADINVRTSVSNVSNKTSS